MKTRTAGSVLLVFLCAGMLHAQDAARDERIAQLSTIGKTDPEYRLGPGDLIDISVFGVDKFKQTLRISASGVIKLPLLDSVQAAGLTARELEDRLTALLDDDIIRHPQVAIFVREYRSQPVFILGAVRNPGQYQITQQLRVVDILSMAGGVLPNAADSVQIQRRAAETDGAAGSAAEEIIKIDLRELLEKGDLSLNVPVRGGDVVHIQERQNHVFYILGEVNRAGAYQLPARQDVRVSQAFASAGGPLKTAKISKGILVRFDDKKQRQQLALNFSDILNGKKEDILIRPDDVIFVPGSKIKDIGYGVLAGVPGSLLQVPYSLAYAIR